MMLDWQGRVAECTGANIFFIKDGVIHTPIADCFLNGITRQTVIELAKRRGIEVLERRILPEELSGLHRVLHHRHRRRGDAGRRDRPLQLHAGPAHRGADRGLHRRGAAQEGGGVKPIGGLRMARAGGRARHPRRTGTRRSPIARAQAAPSCANSAA